MPSAVTLPGAVGIFSQRVRDEISPKLGVNPWKGVGEHERANPS